MCGPEEEKRNRYGDRKQEIRMVEDVEEKERERERILPDEPSSRVHNLRLQSRVESRRGASFRGPSPLGPIDLERAERSIAGPPKIGSRVGVRKYIYICIRSFYFNFPHW